MLLDAVGDNERSLSKAEKQGLHTGSDSTARNMGSPKRSRARHEFVLSAGKTLMSTLHSAIKTRAVLTLTPGIVASSSTSSA
jgi:hypothetical protein